LRRINAALDADDLGALLHSSAGEFQISCHNVRVA